MADPVMNEYRMRKVEEEVFAGRSYKRPCELLIKHGKSRESYWGIPEIEKVTPLEEKGAKLSIVSVIWKTRRDTPIRFGMMLPAGMTMENVMQPCKYLETDRGYQNVISAVIGGLVLLNLVDFYMMATMSEIGLEAFVSPFFIGPFCGVFGAIISLIVFNKTHFTYRLTVECHDPENEPTDAHFVYPVDCDVPVPRQLAWISNHEDLVKRTVEAHAVNLGIYHLDLRGQVAQAQKEKQEILRDRKFERLVKKDEEMMKQLPASIWDNPAVWALVAVVAILGAAVVWLATGAGG